MYDPLRELPMKLFLVKKQTVPTIWEYLYLKYRRVYIDIDIIQNPPVKNNSDEDDGDEMNIPYVNFSIHQQPAKTQEGGNMETTSTARSALREEVVASLEINAEMMKNKYSKRKNIEVREFEVYYYYYCFISPLYINDESG